MWVAESVSKGIRKNPLFQAPHIKHAGRSQSDTRDFEDVVTSTIFPLIPPFFQKTQPTKQSRNTENLIVAEAISSGKRIKLWLDKNLGNVATCFVINHFNEFIFAFI